MGQREKTVYAADLLINYKGAHRVVVEHPLPTTLCSALHHDEEMVKQNNSNCVNQSKMYTCTNHNSKVRFEISATCTGVGDACFQKG